jgi:hypothetical protein
MFFPSRSAHDLERIKKNKKISLDARQKKKGNDVAREKEKKINTGFTNASCHSIHLLCLLGESLRFFPVNQWPIKHAPDQA